MDITRRDPLSAYKLPYAQHRRHTGRYSLLGDSSSSRSSRTSPSSSKSSDDKRDSRSYWHHYAHHNLDDANGSRDINPAQHHHPLAAREESTQTSDSIEQRHSAVRTVVGVCSGFSLLALILVMWYLHPAMMKRLCTMIRGCFRRRGARQEQGGRGTLPRWDHDNFSLRLEEQHNMPLSELAQTRYAAHRYEHLCAANNHYHHNNQKKNYHRGQEASPYDSPYDNGAGTHGTGGQTVMQPVPAITVSRPSTSSRSSEDASAANTFKNDTNNTHTKTDSNKFEFVREPKRATMPPLNTYTRPALVDNKEYRDLQACIF